MSNFSIAIVRRIIRGDWRNLAGDFPVEAAVLSALLFGGFIYLVMLLLSRFPRLAFLFSAKVRGPFQPTPVASKYHATEEMSGDGSKPPVWKVGCAIFLFVVGVLPWVIMVAASTLPADVRKSSTFEEIWGPLITICQIVGIPMAIGGFIWLVSLGV